MQAMIPEGAEILVNKHGSAPGIWLEDLFVRPEHRGRGVDARCEGRSCDPRSELCVDVPNTGLPMHC